MGRTVTKQQSSLSLANDPDVIASWDDVDNRIKDVALLDLTIEEQENQLNGIITDAQARFAPRIKDLKAERAALSDRILAFAERHRADFGSKKSRKFNFGSIAFSKLATKVKFLVEESELIARLKKLGFATGVVKEKEWVDKNALADAVPVEKREKAGFAIEETGDEPQLKIDRKAIELVRQSRGVKAAS